MIQALLESTAGPRQRWQEWMLKLDGMTLRERVIVWLTVAVALWGFWDTVVIQPVSDERHQIEKGILQIQQNLQQQDLLLMQLEAKLKRDPDQEARATLYQLTRQRDEVERRYHEVSQRLVAETTWTQLLQDLVEDDPRLRLLGFTTQPPASSTVLQPIINGVYQKPITVELEGDYFAVLDYLTRLEALPWQIYWRNLQYQVTDYPLGKVKFELFTLAMDGESP